MRMASPCFSLASVPYVLLPVAQVGIHPQTTGRVGLLSPGLIGIWVLSPSSFSPELTKVITVGYYGGPIFSFSSLLVLLFKSVRQNTRIAGVMGSREPANPLRHRQPTQSARQKRRPDDEVAFQSA